MDAHLKEKRFESRIDIVAALVLAQQEEEAEAYLIGLRFNSVFRENGMVFFKEGSKGMRLDVGVLLGSRDDLVEEVNICNVAISIGAVLIREG